MKRAVKEETISVPSGKIILPESLLLNGVLQYQLQAEKSFRMEYGLELKRTNPDQILQFQAKNRFWLLEGVRAMSYLWLAGKFSSSSGWDDLKYFFFPVTPLWGAEVEVCDRRARVRNQAVCRVNPEATVYKVAKRK